MEYQAPIKNMILALEALGFDFDLLDKETVEAVLDEANKLASQVLAPLNFPGDRAGLSLKDGDLKMSEGFKGAYNAYKEGGWNAVPFPEEFGGQEIPWALAFPVQEMWQAANMSFGLCPLLNQGAVEAILNHGSDEQKQYYLPNLVSGEWTGTMNLTEPQAGSDLAQVKTKAAPAGDGSYRIKGQKIYITFGEHDMADNIIHLVLARTPDAPEGVKGISLFIVPKILEDGSRNDLECVGIEHKLGIHASPTCTMSFGDNDGAIGYLVGQENEGLKYMFTMMNNARLSVGLQGVAISDRAYQHALSYAKERVQGKSIETGEQTTISGHADVQRMLIHMRSLTNAGRALTYEAALALDAAHAGDKEAQAKVDILTPIVKAFCTDNSLEITSLGVQVHGGMGFVEETGAAQYYRDARILPIYEGTNGIQAMDLVFRKLLRDKGTAVTAYLEQLKTNASADIKPYLEELEQSTQKLLALAPNDAAYIAVPYLQQFGHVLGVIELEKLLDQAKKGTDQDFTRACEEDLAFYKRFLLPRASAHAAALLAK